VFGQPKPQPIQKDRLVLRGPRDAASADRRAAPRGEDYIHHPYLRELFEDAARFAAQARPAAGDPRVHLVDTTRLKSAFRAGHGATQLAHDGVHPSMYGHAMLAALIAVEVRRTLLQGE
jgi:lysophospholipase L1-like esterase